jgi:hypothetical protein
MIGPVKLVRYALYKRRARKAITFLLHIDRLLRMSGFGRQKVRTLWTDFINHPYQRSAVLRDIATMSHVQIKKNYQIKAETELAATQAQAAQVKNNLIKMVNEARDSEDRAADSATTVAMANVVAELLSRGVDAEMLRDGAEEVGVTIGEADEVPAM